MYLIKINCLEIIIKLQQFIGRFIDLKLIMVLIFIATFTT